MPRRILAACAAAFAMGVGFADAWAQSEALVAARVTLPQPAYETIFELVTFDVAGQTVSGELILPAGVERPPVVLILHDLWGSHFQGTLHGVPTEIYMGSLDLAAELLAEHGLASLRIDFRGSGLSAVNWNGATITSQVADARAAVAWLHANPQVNGRSIGLLGYGHGGLVAASVAATEMWVTSLALWAPIAHPVAFYRARIGAEAIAEALAAEEAEVVVTPFRLGEAVIARQFLEEIHLLSPLAEIARYPGPMLVVANSGDAANGLPPLAGEAFIASHSGREELLAFDTNRDFGASTGADTIEAMTLWTAAWFTLTM